MRAYIHIYTHNHASIPPHARTHTRTYARSHLIGPWILTSLHIIVLTSRHVTRKKVSFKSISVWQFSTFRPWSREGPAEICSNNHLLYCHVVWNTVYHGRL